MDHAFIKAPISGRISRAEITVGNLVGSSTVAPQLLASARSVARLGPEETVTPAAWRTALQSLHGGAVFWVALALVVVVLLVIVARMLPAPLAPK